MFRSVGAVLFGIASDRYGRKWPFVVNNILFIVLELVSSRPSSFNCLFYMMLSLFCISVSVCLFRFILFSLPDQMSLQAKLSPVLATPPHPTPR